MEVVHQMERIELIEDFKFHYRMCKQTFEVVLREIVLDLVHNNTGGKALISLLVYVDNSIL